MASVLWSAKKNIYWFLHPLNYLLVDNTEITQAYFKRAKVNNDENSNNIKILNEMVNH